MLSGERMNIGHDHQIEFVEYEGDAHAGMNYYHKTPSGKLCSGFITFEGSKWAAEFQAIEIWKLNSIHPLTITPSLLCRCCGDHGFITDGEWVKA